MPVGVVCMTGRWLAGLSICWVCWFWVFDGAPRPGLAVLDVCMVPHVLLTALVIPKPFRGVAWFDSHVSRGLVAYDLSVGVSSYVTCSASCQPPR